MQTEPGNNSEIMRGTGCRQKKMEISGVVRGRECAGRLLKGLWDNEREGVQIRKLGTLERFGVGSVQARRWKGL